MAGKRATKASSARPPKTQSAKGLPKKARRVVNVPRRRADDSSDENFSSASEQTDEETARSAKRRKVSGPQSNSVFSSLFQDESDPIPHFCLPSARRRHGHAYHKPLLLGSNGSRHRQSLLGWFDSVSASRAMPWRKAWINPSPTVQPDTAKLREQLERRAYEVWISEIMLQQTRVAVVIDYWNKWMAKWPTIHDLAAADAEDVLATWRGLGYYSRATRIHEASKLVVQDAVMRGLLPSGVPELQAKVPGVGRYTAGAISAIVFGRAAPMVDGNVLRVLSRQLGIYGNIKSDKRVVDTIWAAADAMVKAVARDCRDGQEAGAHDVSDGPGRWGQALMELGSTVCTPKPNCSQCPITASCRAYGEAEKELSQAEGETDTETMPDIEDGCTLCQPFEQEAADDAELKALNESRATTNKTKTPQQDTKMGKLRKQMTLSDFAFTGTPMKSMVPKKPEKEKAEAQESISNYARRFPVKTVKKAVRTQEAIVCAIQRSNGSYLIHRRPEKGLLAGLWEFPSETIADPDQCSSRKQRTELAKGYASSLLHLESRHGPAKPKHVAELGSVPWVFSHLKLTMHVHLFRVASESGVDVSPRTEGQPARWTDDVERESMGTGMRKCWSLVKEADASS